MREHEVSSDEKPVVAKNTSQKGLHTLPGCMKELQSLSLCQIYKETAFIKEKQQGVLHRLVIKG